jgi:hypothetical protein
MSYWCRHHRRGVVLYALGDRCGIARLLPRYPARRDVNCHCGDVVDAASTGEAKRELTGGSVSGRRRAFWPLGGGPELKTTAAGVKGSQSTLSAKHCRPSATCGARNVGATISHPLFRARPDQHRGRVYALSDRRVEPFCRPAALVNRCKWNEGS